MNSSVHHETDGGKPVAINKNGKIKFDRRQYDLDCYADIMEHVEGFDYSKIKADHKKQLKVKFTKVDKATEEITV
jgi:uncharacterized protein YaaW (UPF0174 family)